MTPLIDELINLLNISNNYKYGWYSSECFVVCGWNLVFETCRVSTSMAEGR